MAEAKNPDYILSLVKKDEERHDEGKLKIFFGMAAGVGKTYAMLQAARQLKASGTDVVVGLVEDHGRVETALLVDGLEIIPRRSINYRGIKLGELDTDAVLRRKPKLVLVDELAHTNTPGSRHAKRYLDVLELLKAGIDVYTTLNVQHVESRIDTVRDITRIKIHETIPDAILDRADEIVLIDLPPEELLKRLDEGRIYTRESAKLAGLNFFRRGNLTALREMALRVAAERVDRELRDYKTLYGISGVWKVGGRLMVAIFASPYSEVLIRWTRRVADLLGVTWMGAYVESDEGYSVEEKKLLTKNIEMIKQLGGEVVSTRDNDPVKGLLRMAQQNNVTQIIVGKSQRGWFGNLLRGGSLVNRLLRMSGDIEIYVVSTNRNQGKEYLKRVLSFPTSFLRGRDLAWLFGMTLATWGVATLLQPLIGYAAVGILFLIAVSLSGLFLTRAAVLIMALAFALIHNFFFIHPRLTFYVSRPEDLMLLLMLFIAAAVIGHLTTRLSLKERVLRTREERTMIQYNLAKEIAAAQSVDEVVLRGRDQLEIALGLQVGILIRKETSSQVSFDIHSRFLFSKKEEAVALWTLENGKMSGFGTETLAAAENTYIPILSQTGVHGVAAVNSAKEKCKLTTDQFSIIDAILHQIASGMEREIYHERVKALSIVEETQKLYKSLLDCVSHELKTPLAAIKGAASAIVDPMTSQNPSAVDKLSHQILDASERLQHLVDNLLDMTRIESGHVQPKRILCDAHDVLASALRDAEHLRGDHQLRISVEDSSIPIVCDPVLINQALSNIIQNAFLYTPPDSLIELSANLGLEDDIEIKVRDHGQGLPVENPALVLEKFFRANQTHAGGVGLGLSVSKGFIEAQGGRIEASNHPDGGALFVLHMPRGQVT